MKTKSFGPVLAAALIALAVTGCADGEKSPDKSAAPEQWATTTPAAKGTVDHVTWALPGGEPDTLHWLLSASPSSNTVLSTMCEGLLQIAPDLTIQPWLAESWDAPDDTTFVYHLHDGVTFTDGSPMTADDVVYSLKANTDPDVGSYWGTYFENVTSIEATDDHTVTVKLKQPDPLFNEMMASVASTVVEKRYVESKGDKYGTASGGVGCTGPYSLKSWTPGKSIVVEKKDDYWNQETPPKVGEIEFQFVTNASALVQGLKTGEIDGAYDFPPSVVGSLRSADSGKLYLGKSLGYIDLGFTAKPGTGQDLKVREALSLSLDKPAIAAKLYDGAAQPIRSLFFPSTWSYSPEIFEKGYDALPDGKQDLKRAKELVAEAASPLAPMKMLFNADDPTAQQLSAYIKAQAEAAGLTIELTGMPATQYSTASFDLTQRNEFDLVLNSGGYYNDVPDPAGGAYSALRSDAPYNFSGYANADVDAWINEAMRSTDNDTRAELFSKVAAQAFGKDFVDIAIGNSASLLFMNNRITGAPASFNSHLYGPWVLGLGSAE